MTIEDVIHPGNAVVGSDIDIIVRIKVVAETTHSGRLAFGVLAPASWNIAGSATLTLTTTADFADNVVTSEPLTIIPSSETNPGDDLLWPASFQSKFGVLEDDNPEAMEWVVFESNTTFQIDDQTEAKKVVNGTVNIKLHTGDNPAKFLMGYAFCGKVIGYNGQAFLSKELEVKDVRSASYGPATFGFGDIFSINYTESHSKPAGSAHRGGDVYLLGKVKYEIDGVTDEKTVDETSAKTLMEDLGDMNQAATWQKYIYPKDFFDLPGNAVITEIVVQFANQDKSIISSEFNVEPTCQ
jgi:uncharacterized protein YaiE (UPF0345 family)